MKINDPVPPPVEVNVKDVAAGDGFFVNGKHYIALVNGSQVCCEDNAVVALNPGTQVFPKGTPSIDFGS